MKNKRYTDQIKTLLAAAVAALILFSGYSVLSKPTTDAPILVELFTSEGCSSCPPADRFVKKLQKDNPGRVIVLSEHVDYWNHLGWNDPFSKKNFTKRQYNYAKRFGTSGVYTPQVVVDGMAQAVGSNPNAVMAAIRKAAKKPKGELAVTIEKEPQLKATVKVKKLPPLVHKEPVKLYLALLQDEADTKVLRGENAGRKLNHASVVLKLIDVSSSGGKANFLVKESQKKSSLSIVAFAQGGKSGQIYAVSKKAL